MASVDGGAGRGAALFAAANSVAKSVSDAAPKIAKAASVVGSVAESLSKPEPRRFPEGSGNRMRFLNMHRASSESGQQGPSATGTNDDHSEMEAHQARVAKWKQEMESNRPDTPDRDVIAPATEDVPPSVRYQPNSAFAARLRGGAGSPGESFGPRRHHGGGSDGTESEYSEASDFTRRTGYTNERGPGIRRTRSDDGTRSESHQSSVLGDEHPELSLEDRMKVKEAEHQKEVAELKAQKWATEIHQLKIKTFESGIRGSDDSASRMGHI